MDTPAGQQLPVPRTPSERPDAMTEHRFKEYPVTIGLLIWVLAPLVSLLLAATTFLWLKIDAHSEKLAALAVTDATLTVQVAHLEEKVTALDVSVRGLHTDLGKKLDVLIERSAPREKK
jgi:hypothetical protein